MRVDTRTSTEEISEAIVAITSMFSELTDDQGALARYMSELSEEAYWAGWMQGLEYALWQVVLGERGAYGQLTFSPAHAKSLRRLSDACAGWIVFDDKLGETWVSRSEWEHRFAEWQTTPAAKDVDG